MKRAIVVSLLTLLLPASALADTTTVDPAAGGSCARGGTCAKIGDAVGVAQASDTITIKAGTYAESVTIPSAKTGLILAGTPGAVLSGSGSATALNVQAATTKVTGLTIFTQAATDPTVVDGAGGLTITDSTVYAFAGTAISLTGGTGNLIQRSTVVTLAPAAASDAIKLAAGAATIDSSLVIGGSKGAAYRVTTTAGSADASLTLNHVTTTGTGMGIVLDGAGSVVPAQPVGDIALKVNGSIVHGASTASESAGQTTVPPLPNVQDPNTVTAAYTNSDATAMTKSGGTGDPAISGGGNPTADSLLFTKTLRLKASAPVIDKGGAIVAGESDTDIDGDPRTNGAATDIGADEFTNHAPTLTKLVVKPTEGKTGQPVVAQGFAADKEGPEDILGYSFDWGDGTKADSSTSSIYQHGYEKPGTYTITVIVADRSFATSEPMTQTITVTDGTPPQLQITTPKEGAKVKLTKGAKKKPLQYTIKGVDADPSGIKQIEVALTKTGSSCLQYTGTKFAKASCTKYVFLKATLSGNGFKLITKKGLRVPKGTYEIRARGTDTKDNVTSTFDKGKTLVTFKVK